MPFSVVLFFIEVYRLLSLFLTIFKAHHHTQLRDFVNKIFFLVCFSSSSLLIFIKAVPVLFVDFISCNFMENVDQI